MWDELILAFDRGLRTVFGPARSERPAPHQGVPDGPLNPAERQHAAALMRVNHVGEVCAQALYQGQAIVSRNDSVRTALIQASAEEVEHLAWTADRIAELDGRRSLLNPLWYGGALLTGLAAGVAGDRWNLGFLAETERQVEAHLAGHLVRLPEGDARSRAIVSQMMQDERGHAALAVRLGAAELPFPVRAMMRAMARVMTATAYRL